MKQRKKAPKAPQPHKVRGSQRLASVRRRPPFERGRWVKTRNLTVRNLIRQIFRDYLRLGSSQSVAQRISKRQGRRTNPVGYTVEER